VRPLTESITVHQALADLHAALQKPEMDDAALKRQVTLVREARQRAREALADARAELLPLLTARQEAALEANGFFEE
jgi:Spy/CpxP family protein refolding chaperone